MRPKGGNNMLEILELGNLRIIDLKHAYIQIIGSTIVGITDKPKTNRWIDCNNNLAIPGLIDMHVHDRYGQPKKETPTTLEQSAILGGVTLFAKMPNTNPELIYGEMVLTRAEEDSQLKISTRFWLGATLDNIFEIIQVAKYLRHLVVGIKIYMGSSTGNLLVADPKIIKKIFQTCAEYNIMVGVHAEDESMMNENLARFGGTISIADHCVIRSTEVEVSAVRLALMLQEQTDCRLYFCHISAPESLELIMNAKQKGRTVYAEVCPHHIYLDQHLLQRHDGGKFKMNPPLRTWSQVDRIAKYVCAPGWVDVISTDHAPHQYPEEKIGQPYQKTASGVTGIQTMLPLMFTFVKNHEMEIQHFINLTSANAARIFGLNGKGRLEVGADADITIINDTEMRTIKNEDMATLWRNTPFNGMIACGFPSHVIAQGKLVLSQQLTAA